MQAYEATVSYKIIYIYSIPDGEHKGFLKIGETTLESVLSPEQLRSQHSLLSDTAKRRINQQNRTAMNRYELLHVELAERLVQLADGSTRAVTFRDSDVHDVLDRSGYLCRRFTDTGRKSEWYQVDLQTAIHAISAVKEGRTVLNESERTAVSTVPAARIELRDEQKDAITKTLRVYRRTDSMLWDCKMRFGKTLTTCALAKEMGVQKTIIVTHRPVVVDGWEKDFHLIFGDSGDYVFQTKVKRGGDEAEFDAAIDAGNTAALHNLASSGTRFFYFASVQDLRGSKRAGGNHPKNEAVFDMDWDFIVYDEAHEGTQTELGQKVQMLLETSASGKRPKVLHLSGTPYNIMARFEDNVYSWDYVMEQRRKREWAEQYPDLHNPYADLPEMRIFTFDLRDSMPTSYRYETEEMAFNFREFFRVWTGDASRDFRPVPQGAHVGDCVHEEDVISFLNLISSNSEDNLYPFSRPEYRDMFRHTFWIVPGVKEARALSKLLRKHPVFGYFGIANVSGEGDEEQPYEDALKQVREVIQNHDYSITISCGRLTTGVTVPEWTAVMMLTGGPSVSAASYMQTIFRVQSAGSINGKQKERCYVFDFAPDRALNVLSEVHNIRQKGVRKDEESQAALGEFLNFCPVIAVSGTGMREYDVPNMMRQIKRLTVDRAIKNGFDDESVYRSDTGIVMDEADAQLFHELGGILTGQKKAKLPSNVSVNDQGLTAEEYEQSQKVSNKHKKQLTPQEEELLKKLKEQRKERSKVIALLRNISIRLPMLIYGADKDLSETIRMGDFVTMVDDESWAEFMPKGISKALFKKLLKYYDEDVVMGAGLRIRRMAKAADELPPTRRVQRIAEIFNHFRNPDKETVLTPWRVVNMHLSDMLGGWCFYDEGFAQPDGLLDKPRWVDRGAVTADLFRNSGVKILEMNSKSGLYPLYMAYSLYAAKLKDNEDKLSGEETQRLWAETLAEQVFVLCKTKMARQITIRTLAGYTGMKVNAVYLTKLMERMKDQKRLANKLTNPDTWDREGERMKFDAIVGNPPYQLTGGSGGTNDAPIYQNFVNLASAVSPRYSSLIIPSRWFTTGRENLLGEFRRDMLNNRSIKALTAFPDSHDVFSNVEIKGGLCYYLIDSEYDGECRYVLVRDGNRTATERKLNDFDILIRDPELASIVKKVTENMNNESESVASIISNDTPFGIPTNPKSNKKKEFDISNIKDEKHDVALFYLENLKRVTSYISIDAITKNIEDVDRIKVFIPEAGGSGNDPYVIGKPELAPKRSVCSQTFLYAVFNSENEANNFISYLKTKLFRILVSACKISQHTPSKNYRFVPLQDFSKSWTDTELYEKYNLTQDEIAFVERMIKPMG